MGEDLRAGETVLEAGVLLGPAELGLLSAAAAPRPVCRRRPSVAVLTTGDELHGPDGALAVGGVRDTSIYALPALVRQAGAECVEASTIGDAADVVTGELRRLLATADVLIVCGGVSVGEHDHVRPALARLGVEEIFWGIALKPGRPTWFGAGEGRRVFGLPGNPVSAIVTFLLLVRPALLAMGGRGSTGGRVSATLTEPVARNRNRTQAVRVRISEGPESRLATPTGPQGSHVLSSMLGAGGLAIIGAGEGEVKAGERIEVELLPGAG